MPGCQCPKIHKIFVQKQSEKFSEISIAIFDKKCYHTPRLARANKKTFQWMANNRLAPSRLLL